MEVAAPVKQERRIIRKKIPIRKREVKYPPEGGDRSHTATTSSRVLRARLEFLQDKLQISEGDFLSFDAARQAGQYVGLGRVIQSKADYGMVIFAGKRYCRCKTRSKLLPGWLLSHLSDAHLNLSPGMALHIVRKFLGKVCCHKRT